MRKEENDLILRDLDCNINVSFNPSGWSLFVSDKRAKKSREREEGCRKINNIQDYLGLNRGFWMFCRQLLYLLCLFSAWQFIPWHLIYPEDWSGDWKIERKKFHWNSRQRHNQSFGCSFFSLLTCFSTDDLTAFLIIINSNSKSNQDPNQSKPWKFYQKQFQSLDFTLNPKEVNWTTTASA